MAVEGTRGDVHPMLALGTSLLARGHEVLVLPPPPDFAEAALAQGMEFRAVGTSVRAYLTAHARARVAGIFFRPAGGRHETKRDPRPRPTRAPGRKETRCPHY